MNISLIMNGIYIMFNHGICETLERIHLEHKKLPMLNYLKIGSLKYLCWKIHESLTENK